MEVSHSFLIKLAHAHTYQAYTKSIQCIHVYSREDHTEVACTHHVDQTTTEKVSEKGGGGERDIL